MLVLSRKLGESIVIGDGITVTIIEVKGERVRLGFTAPAEVPSIAKNYIESWKPGFQKWLAVSTTSFSNHSLKIYGACRL